MNKNLINTIVGMTGKDEPFVQEKLATLSVNEIYKLMDFVRNNKEDEVLSMIGESTDDFAGKSFDVVVKVNDHISKDGLLDWLDDHSIGYMLHPSDVVIIKNTSRANEIKVKHELAAMRQNSPNTIQILKDSMSKLTTGKMPKPRNPVAKALALPQYRQKVTPTKKEIQDKMDSKHPNKFFEDETELVAEGVMGMTTMTSMLPRLLTLAGCAPYDETSTVDELPRSDDAITLTATGDCNIADDEINYDMIADDDISDSEAEITASHIQVIRDSFEQVRLNIRDIKLSEFSEVRSLLSDLMSHIDRIANNITNK